MLGGLAAATIVVGAVAGPALIKGKVTREARARGLEVRIGSVRLGWSSFWLHQVSVRMVGAEVALELEAVRIGAFGGGLSAHGGWLRGRGDPTRVLRRLRGPDAERASSSGTGSREVFVEGLFVDWQGSQANLRVYGAAATMRGGAGLVTADLVQVKSGRLDLEAQDLLVESERSGGHVRLKRAEVGGTQLNLGELGEVGAAVAPAEPELSEVGDESRGPSGKLRQARSLLMPLVRDGLAGGGRISIERVSARVRRGRETVSFGPSRFSVARENEQLRMSLTPTLGTVEGTPLSLMATVPLAPGIVHVTAKGGPVSLASLGMLAGQGGVRDVGEATVAADGSADFAQDFETVRLDGKVTVRGLAVEWPKLSSLPVGPWGFDVTVKARARLDGSEVEVIDGEARSGDFRLELSGRLETGLDRRHAEGRLRVPLSGCQSLLEAMPRGLLPLASDMRLGGSFGVELRLRYDMQAPKDVEVVLAARNECRVDSVPEQLSPDKFARPFLRETRAHDGSTMAMEGGPGTPGWVAIDDVSRHVESAILICEDSRFHAHHGFDFRALEDAIKDDLRAGRFARGASTVSMQLAKNLYLGREKTVGRKLQEALFTILLEQELTKRRILELYLNVVELGPGLYGIGDAAQYYFATPARDLSLGQALYLASILPNPTFSHFGPDGRLSPKWQSYLRRLMHIARKIKRIDDAELEAGLAEELEFRSRAAEATGAPTQPDVDGLAPEDERTDQDPSEW